jgi:hypothetical protein
MMAARPGTRNINVRGAPCRANCSTSRPSCWWPRSGSVSSCRFSTGRLGPLSQDAVDLGTGLFRWAWTYVIRGAAVIVPLWLIYVLLTYLRRR